MWSVSCACRVTFLLAFAKLPLTTDLYWGRDRKTAARHASCSRVDCAKSVGCRGTTIREYINRRFRNLALIVALS